LRIWVNHEAIDSGCHLHLLRAKWQLGIDEDNSYALDTTTEKNVKISPKNVDHQGRGN